jgi:hypothetical protein
VAVHPSGTANQEERQRIHEAIIPSAHNGDQHFVAERPLGLARKDPYSKSLNVVRVLGQYAVSSLEITCIVAYGIGAGAGAPVSASVCPRANAKSMRKLAVNVLVVVVFRVNDILVG